MRPLLGKFIGFLAVGLLLGMLLAYWVRLLQDSFQEDLPLNSPAITGFAKWLLGWFVLIDLVLLVAWANYRWPYQKWYVPTRSEWKYWCSHVAITWLAFEALQWRTDREPELVDENIQVSLLFSGLLLGFAWIAEAARLKRAHTVLMKERAEAELRTLRNQINPHFLFNALNTIYSQSLGNNPATAAELVHKLSGILRFALQQSQADFIPIAEEIALLEKYTDLHRARLPQQAKDFLCFEAHWDGVPCQIAPLLLLPFVENAIQYGLHPQYPTEVQLKLEVVEKQLFFSAINTVQPSLLKSQKGTGQGIDNVQKRIQLIYPHQHTLQVQTNNNLFDVQLNINLFKP
jgi:hypothetical protein